MNDKTKLLTDEEPVRFSELYKKEFGRLLKDFDNFQRAAKMRDHMASTRDPYRTELSDAALGYGGKRSDYGQTRSVSVGDT